jgi:hypothetical protein
LAVICAADKKEIRLPKDPIMQKLISLRANRKGEENAFVNLIGNLYRHRKFVHDMISEKLSESQMDMVISRYVVSLVTCWETFFRDVFVFLLKRHPSISDRLRLNKKVQRSLRRAPDDPAVEEEFIANIFNFQNLDSLRDAFAPILGTIGKLELPARQDAFIHVKGKGWLPFSLSNLFPKWKDDLNFILQERHRIIHDANHSGTISRKDIQRIESVLFFYLQLFGIFVSNRFQLP